jgi:hypothetical protein
MSKRRSVLRKLRFGCVVGGFVMLASPSAWAGHPQERKGFWIGFGAGYGSASASADCDGCGGDREGSVTGFLKLGGTLNPHVLLGVETNVWVKDEGDNTTLTLGAFTGTVTLYPQAEGGFFLKAGVGASYVSSEFREGSLSASIDKTGWAVLVGAGYDLRVGRNISLTPCINYHYGKPGDIDFEGETVFPGWKQNVVSFELGITFH